ncbi:MAG: protease PrsW [Chloroflexota bacterium]|jgi:RsiW-degrading membrane proteinase PrsW (M82 family)|nr:protease PrsW [Chloroflexota bacterium]
MWLAAFAVARVTHNIILLPTIVLIGSFVVPVTAVVWYLDHDPSPALSPRRILAAFIIAGVFGVLGASLLEYWLVSVGFLGSLEVGLIEEAVKGVFIVVVALGIRPFHVRDGMVLGATVGFGFAALESSGYALASLFVVQGGQLYLSLTSVVITELIRGVLSPFGHGMWSAILGGAIFAAAARRGRLSPSGTVLVAYLGVSVLHGAFDSINGVLGYVMVSLVGLVPLIWLWRRSDGGGVLPRRHQPIPTAASIRP